MWCSFSNVPDSISVITTRTVLRISAANTGALNLKRHSFASFESSGLSTVISKYTCSGVPQIFTFGFIAGCAVVISVSTALLASPSEIVVLTCSVNLRSSLGASLTLILYG